MVYLDTFDADDTSSYFLFACISYIFHIVYFAIMTLAFTTFSEYNAMTYTYIALPLTGILLTNILRILTRMKNLPIPKYVFLALKVAILSFVLWMTYIIFVDLKLELPNNK